MNENSCVFLVHVPELRRFTADAKKSMSELAWMNAQGVVKTSGIAPPTTLAVGVKGAMLYDSVMIGHVVPQGEQGGGITREGSGLSGQALLYPFFAPGSGQDDGGTLAHVDRVRAEVANILEKAPEQIDLHKPLTEQGADELDIVEIVMALEEAFNVEIPDSALDGTGGELSKSLSVERLVQLVTEQAQSK